ncbi:MAG: type II toxin-antitoxin system RelE/ParE family toxin [Gammaproteobacteria bacterium]|nr:type II toxin-antitoxin system RelE/ParE family toxin [Gammaproteobacteria bacterium]
MYDLSQEALKDINVILDWTIDNFGANAMFEYHRSLTQCFTTLGENPNLGVSVESIRKGYWCFYHRSHAVFYTYCNSKVFIVRVLHKSMDVPRHFI